MIVSDIIESHTLRRTAAGYGIDRIFIISDVTGNPQARLYNATITSGVPQYGDPHPVIPDIQVTDIQASPESNDSESVKIRVTYASPTADDSEAGEGDLSTGIPVISSGLTQEQTTLDINGEFILVQFFGGGGFSTKWEAVTVQRPQMRVTLTRIESSIPKFTIAHYLGRVNSSSWSGFGAKTWLLAGINANQDKGKYRVEYSFIYRPETWQAVVTVRIPADVIDDFPPDVKSGNGYAKFDVYDFADFNSLGLSF